MIALKPSSLPAASPNSAEADPLNLQDRLEAATEALLKTRDQVVEALDRHLGELDMLRRALSKTAEKPLLSMVPPPVAPVMPVPQVPVYRHFEQPPHEAAPVLPLLTQVMWPSKQSEPAAAPQRYAAPAPAVAAAPVSSPLVAYPSLAGSASRDAVVDPDLEKATLEELNAALAYAFSHVSNSRHSTQPQAGLGNAQWSNSGTQGFGSAP